MDASFPSWTSPRYIARSTFDGVHFNFLNTSGYLSKNDGWNDDQYSKLWLYNLHYLNDLNAKDLNYDDPLGQELLEKWIKGNPAAIGNGWEPYPISLRVVNILKWISNQNRQSPLWITSVAEQMRFLEKRIEYHILANHLFANGKALVFAGTYVSGNEGKKWLTKGLEIIDEEVAEQFLDDGAHFELSPMYHAIMMWDMCDLVRLSQLTKRQELQHREKKWREVISNGMYWLLSMTHPDGEISFFNDAAFGVAPKKEELIEYVKLLGINYKEPAVELNSEVNLVNFESSGYIVMQINEDSKLICDVGNIQPSYQPGHAHADTLSFELSLSGQRVFVNSGTSEYGDGNSRQYQRGTAAHNTVVVNESNSSEVWAGFRVARRAKCQIEKIQSKSSFAFVQAKHDGYSRFCNEVLHIRSWEAKLSNLVIKDYIRGKHKKAEANFFIHPEVSVKIDDQIVYLFLKNGLRLSLSFQNASSVTLIESSWHPYFSKPVKNFCIKVLISNNELVSKIDWGMKDSNVYVKR